MGRVFFLYRSDDHSFRFQVRISDPIVLEFFPGHLHAAVMPHENLSGFFGKPYGEIFHDKNIATSLIKGFGLDLETEKESPLKRIIFEWKGNPKNFGTKFCDEH